MPQHLVRKIAGHSDIEVTRTTYAHVSLDDKRKALGKLGGSSDEAIAVNGRSR